MESFRLHKFLSCVPTVHQAIDLLFFADGSCPAYQAIYRKNTISFSWGLVQKGFGFFLSAVLSKIEE
jgi:hypothetical protein